MKKIVSVILIFLLIGVVIGIITYWINKSHPSGLTSTGQIVTIRIRYGFTVQNQTNQSVDNTRLWTFAPVKKTSNQVCKSIEASHPFKIVDNQFGNQRLHFVFDKIPPYGSRIITITADVDLLKSVAKIPTSEHTQYLLPEIHIESDHPEIVKISQSLETEDIVETAQNYYQWVSQHIQYERSFGSPKGALYALTHQKGDCTEHADLFAALCRAAHIPARSVGGYVCPQNSVLKPSDYHNWAEFYHDGKWQIADSQKKQFPEENSQYIATRIIHSTSDQNVPDFDKFWISDPSLLVKMNY